jgi:long-chain acyl-CoA synthetase
LLTRRIDVKANIKTVGQIYKNHYTEDKTAILFKDLSISFGELNDRVIAFANYFRSIGVQKGDKFILDTGNSPEFLCTYLGVVRNAAVIVPVNPLLTFEEIKYIAGDAQAKFILIHEGVLARHGLAPAELEALGLTVLVLNEALISAIMQAPREDFDLVTDENEISTFLYTSGTTGKPKAAMLTHFNLVQNAAQCAAALETRSEDVFMCVLPMFHVFAFTACILLPMFVGATVDIVESFSPKEVVSDLVGKGITIFMGVPTMYVVLIEAGKKDIVFPKLRLAISGGAALPVEVYYQARDSINLPIIEGYGLTEASPAAVFNPPSGIQKPGTIGLPIPEIEFRIGGDNDEDLPPGEVGELLLRGPNIMQGYYNLPQESAEALKNGWLHTGDLATRDEDGYISIVDRKKDMIIVSGLNVYPREVEEVLYQYPKIKEAAVIGELNPLRGETVVAYVVLKEGETAHHKEILRWLKSRLASYKLPRRIEVMDDLPKNASGKIMKRLLKEK